MGSSYACRFFIQDGPTAINTAFPYRRRVVWAVHGLADGTAQAREARIIAMSRTIIATDGAPAAIGPYSQGVRVGNLIFTAGQIPLDPATQQVVAGGITEQATRVLENLKAILEEASSSMDRVVKSTVYLKSMEDFAAMNAVYDAYLGRGEGPPARTTVEVSRLPKNVLVEIDVVAEAGPAGLDA